MTRPDDFVDVVIRVLQEKSVNSSRLPEINKEGLKTPDLLAEDETATYLIEVKVKENSPVDEIEKTKVLNSGGVYESVRETTYSSSINAIIDTAASQLWNYDKENSHIHLVWCEMSGIDERLHYMRFRNTLYGIVNIVDFSTGISYEAFYFDYSAIFRNRTKIDAVILTFSGEGLLCINDAGHSIKKLKSSKLYAAFGTAICSPIDLEKTGNALIVDGSHSRSDDIQSVKFIQNKYGIQTITPIRFKEFSASVAIPRNA